MGDSGDNRQKREIRTIACLVCLALAYALPAAAVHAPPTITSPADGAAVGSPAVPIQGSASGDAVSVAIYEGPTLRTTTTVASGWWSASVAFADGSHTVTARARDAANTESAPSDPVTFLVDTANPGVPVITVPGEGSTLTDTNITVEGSAEPGVRVEVEVSTGGMLQATADAAGLWRASRNFSSATHTLRATAIDAAGNRSLQSAPRTFRVDLVDPNPPVIHGPSQGERVNVTDLRIWGFAEQGATVRIYEGSEIAAVVTGTDGMWSVIRTFSEGSHSIYARATDTAGRVSGLSGPRSFFVDLTPPDSPTILSPAENGLVAPGVTVTGRADAGVRVDLLRGTSNSSFGSATADNDGRWSIGILLQHGTHTIRARATDAAGNVGADSAVRTFKVDGDTPTIEFTTPNETIFWPSMTTAVRGVAADSMGVKAIELQWYDVLGKALPYRSGSCAACPLGTNVDWFSYWSPPRGRYVIKAYAIDRVGHRSEPSIISVVRL